ncbi:winged helix-turn-helix transcriptional regulator [Brevibacterium sp. FAM 24638]|uniref:winged helix-turn-helix transcriptional regulator n=1 Tax=unclassified Brevibacterium TaxID=2614124 RepID=UPI003C7CF839
MTNQTESDAGWDDGLVPGVIGRTVEPHHECPVEVALEAVKGRWTTLVLRDLMHGVRTYSALSQGLPKLSDKVLVDVLAHLRKQGLVCRTVVRGYPNRTLYGMTADGWKLRPLLVELYRTGERLRQRP